ncbi:MULTISPECIES: hypothetical protein [Shouchella]|uniref:Holin n=2 Tax=Shouchella TaxID=2893057 RepID=A0ABY7WDU2_9BACI|nr:MULTISPECIES: hypothetical protein [Shouchella]MED4128812.1 hypothetical protein [Shouchella miscanthi]WDF05833.1 hypothetical protein PQ477_10470 [Shouchella hunanensis]
MDYPTIHTNIWDGVIAVPSVLLLTQAIKMMFPIKSAFVPTVATLLGLCISIFISHPHNLLTGIFMGLFYGNAAVGAYSGIKNSWVQFRKRYNE